MPKTALTIAATVTLCVAAHVAAQTSRSDASIEVLLKALVEA